MFLSIFFLYWNDLKYFKQLCNNYSVNICNIILFIQTFICLVNPDNNTMKIWEYFRLCFSNTVKLITNSSSNIFIVISGKGRRRKHDHARRHCSVPGYRGCCDDRCCYNHCEKKVGLFEMLLLLLLMLFYRSSLLLFFLCLKSLLFLTKKNFFFFKSNLVIIIDISKVASQKNPINLHVLDFRKFN